MARVQFSKVNQDRWYNIILFADYCKSYGRTHTEEFEARFNGEWWIDINGVQYSVHSVYRIDDELAF